MLRLLFFLAITGALVYGLVWLIQHARAAKDNPRPVAPPPPPPDDDPVFLAQLDRRLREERRQREAAEAQRRAAERPDPTPPTSAEPGEGDAQTRPDGIEAIKDAEDDPDSRA
ncbi:hypothetical protein [Salana multivorans]